MSEDFSILMVKSLEYLSILKDGSVVLNLHIQPKASRAGFRGIHDGSLKLAVTAAPVDGKANKAVIDFLSSFFKRPKREIALISGQTSKRKRFVIKGMSRNEVFRCLDGRTDSKG